MCKIRPTGARMDQDISDENIGDHEADADAENDAETGAEGENEVEDIAVESTPADRSVCPSCGADVVGTFCPGCGQKNDDLRRSLFVLARDFLGDTFNFDSRMWHTLGLLATSPGLVPSDYSHGRRSTYTPPVRLFLVVSFLFFLTLGMTQTMFVALEVAKKTPEQIAAKKHVLKKLDVELPDGQTAAQAAAAAGKPGCNLNFNLKFFVRPTDIVFDQAAWRACVGEIPDITAVDTADSMSKEDADAAKRTETVMLRIFSGLSRAVENPVGFNAAVNAWLPRVMLFMAPVLALLLSLFIRGRDALYFDHLVLAFYIHAVGFTVAGAAIVAAQLGLVFAGAIAVSVLAVYFVMTLRRAYHRGWVKTLFASAFVSLFYLIILMGAVTAIASNVIWRGAEGI